MSKKIANENQERFCWHVAAGEYQSAAYRLAGYKCTERNSRNQASRLAAQSHIQKRIRELQAEMMAQEIRDAAKIAVTKGYLIRSLMDDRRKAMKRDRPEIAVRCLVEIGKLGGHYGEDIGRGGNVHINFNTKELGAEEHAVVAEERRKELQKLDDI